MGCGTRALRGLIGLRYAFRDYELDGLVVAHVHNRRRRASISTVSVVLRSMRDVNLPSMDLLEDALVLRIVVAHQRTILDAETIAPQMKVANGLLCTTLEAD